jgi:hypothetical protein
MALPTATSAAAPFSLRGIDCLGFDMDHTLVRYRMEPFSRLVFACMRDYIVEHCGYPRSLLALEYESAFASKGVIFDRRLGTFVKLDASGAVVRAQHGAAFLSAAQIAEAYPTRFADFSGVKTARLFPIITAFELPVCSLIARLVDLIDARLASAQSPSGNGGAADASDAPLPPAVHQSFDPARAYLQPFDADAYSAGGHAAAYERLLSDIFAGFNFSFSNYHSGKCVSYTSSKVKLLEFNTQEYHI